MNSIGEKHPHGAGTLPVRKRPYSPPTVQHLRANPRTDGKDVDSPVVEVHSGGIDNSVSFAPS